MSRRSGFFSAFSDYVLWICCMVRFYKALRGGNDRYVTWWAYGLVHFLMRKGLSHTPRKATWLPSTQQARLYPGLISWVNIGCLRMFKDCQQHKGMTAGCRAMCYTVPSLLPFIANPFQQQQLPLGVETDAQLGVAYCCLTLPLILDPPNNITFHNLSSCFLLFFPDDSFD